MSASDARPVPRKNVDFRLYFAFRDDNNDLVTSWGSSPTVAYSIDGGTMTGQTPTYITEIASSSGCGYVDIGAGTMNCDCLVVKLGLSGANDVVVILYPEEIGDYRVRVEQISLAASGDIAHAVWDADENDHTVLASMGYYVPKIEDDVGAIHTEIGTNGDNLSDIPWNADWDIQVQSEVYDALNEAIPGSPTVNSVFERVKAVDDKILGTMTGDIAAGTHNPQGGDAHAIVSNETYGNSALNTDLDAILVDIVDIKGTDFVKDTHSLVDIAGASAPDAATIADAVWNETSSGHVEVGKAGAQLWTDIDAILVDTGTTLHNYVDCLPVTLNNFDPTSDKVYLGNGAHGGAGASLTLSDYTNFKATGFATAGEPLTSVEVAQAVWNATMSSYDTPNSTGHALVAASGNLFGVNVIEIDGDPVSVTTAADIADAVWDESSSGHVDAGKAGAQLWTDIDAILVDTGDLQGNQGSWATATSVDINSGTQTFNMTGNITGNLSGSVGSVTAAVETDTASRTASKATGFATPTNITAGTITTVTNLTNAPTAGDLTATMKASVNTQVDTAIETYYLDHLFATDYNPAAKPGTSTALLNELVESDVGVSRFTANALEQGPTGSAPDAATIATAVWDKDISAYTTDAGDYLKSLFDNQGGWATATSVTVSDKTGFSLSAAGIDAIWDEPMAAHTTGGTFGDTILDNLNATVSSRSSHDAAAVYTAFGTGSNLTALGTAANQTAIIGYVDGIEAKTNNLPSDPADASVIAAAFTSLESHGDSNWATATSVTVSDKTGFSLSAAGIDAIWDEPMAAHTTGGTFGDTILDNLNATVSSRSSHNAASVWAAGGRTLSTQDWSTHSAEDVAEIVGASGMIAQAAWEYDGTRSLTTQDWSTHNAADVNTTLTSSHGAGDWTTATSVTVSDKTGFSLSAAGIDAIWDEPMAAHTTGGTFGDTILDNLNATVSSRSSHSDADVWTAGSRSLSTQDWSTHNAAAVVTALDTGSTLTAIPWNANWDAEVQSECAEALTAYDPPTKTEMDSGFSGLNDPTSAAIADAVWNETLSDHVSAGSTGQALVTASGNLIGAGSVLTLNDIADAVWNETSSGHVDAGKAGAQIWTDIDAILYDTGTTLDDKLDTIDNYVDELETRLTAERAGYLDNLSGHTPQTGDSYAVVTHGTYGLSVIENYVDGIESKTNNLPSDPADASVIAAAFTSLESHGDSNWATATSVTVSDKTGFSLSAAGIDAIWDEPMAAHTTGGTFGDTIKDNLNATVSSRSTHNAASVWAAGGRTLSTQDWSTHSAEDVAEIVGASGMIAQAAWEYDGTRSLTTQDWSTHNAADVNTTLTSSHGAGDWTTATSVAVSDKTGFSLSAAGIDAIWDEPMAAHTTGGTFGDTILDNLNATVSSRSSHNAASVYTAFGTGSSLTTVGLSTTALNNVNAEVDTALGDYDGPTKTEMDSAFTEIKGSTWSSSTDTLEDIRDEIVDLNDPTSASIADAVWDESIANHDTPGSTGHALVVASGNLMNSGYGGPSLADIADAVWDEDQDAHTTADTFGYYMYQAYLDTNETVGDLNNLITDIGSNGVGLTNLPWNSSWDSEVQGEVTNALNSYDPPTKTEMDSGFSGLNDPTSAAIADAVWNETLSDHVSAGSTGQALVTASGNLIGAGSVLTLNDIADAVWNETSSGHVDAGKAGAQLWTDIDAILVDTGDLQGNQGSWATATSVTVSDKTGFSLSAAGIDAIWDEPMAAHTTGGTFGDTILDNLNATVSSRSSHSDADVWTAGSRSLSTQDWSTHNAAAVVTALDTGSTLTAIPWNANWDAEVQSECAEALTAYDPPTKTEMDSGFSGLNDPTTSQIADAVWDEAIVSHDTPGTTGHALVIASGNLISGDWGDATASNQTAIIGYVDGIEAKTNNLPSDPADASVIAAAFTSLESHGDSNWATATSVTVSDKTGFSLSAAGIDAIWDEPMAAHTTGGTFGDTILDNLNATVSSRSSHNAASVWAAGGRTLSTQDWSTHSAEDVAEIVGASGMIAQAAWEYDGTRSLTTQDWSTHNAADVNTTLTSSHGAGDWTTATSVTVSDKTGFSLSAAGIDAIWDEPMAAHTTGGTFGDTILDNLNATVSSRSSHSDADVWTAGSRSLSTQDWSTHNAAAVVTALDTGSTLTAIPWNANWDAEVQSECAEALTAYDPPTKTEMDSGFSGLNDPTSAAIADAVWNETLSDHVSAGSTGQALVTASGNLIGAGSVLTEAGIADAVWNELVAGHDTTNSYGDIVHDYLDASVSSRSTFDHTSDTVANVTTVATTTNLTNLPTIPTNWLTADGLAADAVTEIEDGVWGYATRTVTNLGDAAVSGDIRGALGLASANLDTQLDDIPTVSEFNARTLLAASYFDPAADTVANVTTVGSVTNAVTVGTINSDVINSTALATTAVNEIVDQVWNEILSSHDTPGSTGHALVTASGNLIGGDWSTHNAASVWVAGGRTLSTQDWSTHSAEDVAEIVGASGMIAQAAWEYDGTRSLTTQDWSTHNAADVNTTLTSSHGAGDWTTATGFALLGEPLTSIEVTQAVWDATMSDYDTAGTTGHALVAASGNLIGGAATAPTADTVAAAVWNKTLSSHTTPGSTGHALVVASGNLISGMIPSGVWSYDTRTLTGITEANMVQVSGEYVSLNDLNSFDASGLATTAQLEYWGLLILNHCGGGPVG